MYPKIEINVDNIIENAVKTKELCESKGVKLSLVTKVLAGNKYLVERIVKEGKIDCICESRIQNLIEYKDINVEKWLIRIPMISECADVVKYADASLNSEINVIAKLNEEAKAIGKKHKIILMYELGDLREGCMKDELDEVLSKALKMDNIEVYGIGVNLSCYGEIIPTKENMKELVDVVVDLEKKYNYKFKVISGGNSSSYNMLKRGEIPGKINNLRFGESVFLGNVPCFEEPINELNRNSFILKAEVIELKDKPSVPWGKTGNSNSFGEIMTFEDRGIRSRAIIALGKQDIRIEAICPVDKDIVILDGSSDHIILDVTAVKKKYKVGDIIDFKLSYAGVLSANSSKYIERSFV